MISKVTKIPEEINFDKEKNIIVESKIRNDTTKDVSSKNYSAVSNDGDTLEISAKAEVKIYKNKP